MTIKYHFFGQDVNIKRDLKDRDHLNQNLIKQGFKNQKTLFLNQIHSAKVTIINSPEQIYSNQNLPKADSIITNQKNINIGLITADCAPILFFCDKSQIIAATHAGWRGAKSGVINNTINAMQDLGATNISAIIGPMIQAKSYEISQDFYDDFLEESKDNKKFFITSTKAGKYYFDLNEYCVNKIRNCAVTNIQNNKIDTYQNNQKYFSYRRATQQNIEDCGRNVALISLS